MITLGADPEVFLRDRNTGNVVPAIGLVGGTKRAPLPIPEMDDGYAAQEDNVMLEYNIPPCGSAGAFAAAVTEGLAGCLDFIRIKHPTIELDFASSRVFSAQDLNHPQAREFGCSPDFDAYTGGLPTAPVSAVALETEGGAWRFAGGHVHLGYERTDVPDHVIAMMADVLLGLPSVALDKQGERRKLYGTPGRYRPTAYGIEYRTLSNFWVFDPATARGIGKRALILGRLLSVPERVAQLYEELPWNDIHSAMTTENEDLAADLVAYCRNDLKLGE